MSMFHVKPLFKACLLLFILITAACGSDNGKEKDKNAEPISSIADPVIPEPETPDPETLDPETPDPETPDPETPDPETPDPETPDPETPDPDTPDPETPDPETPDPETPDPETPDPETPDPEIPDPEIPDPEDGVHYQRAANLPDIHYASEHTVENGLFDILPSVSANLGEHEVLHWVKAYGPDGVNVQPETGRVTWDIQVDTPAESFHVGIKVSAVNESRFVNFIVHHNVPQVLTVGPSGDYPNIAQGLANLSSGGTLIIEDGEYEGDANLVGLTLPGALHHPPSGNEDGYTTIMARNPGEAVLLNGAYVKLRALNGFEPVSYVAFKGLFVIDGQFSVFGYGENKEASPLRHHHIKFIRNGVQGGETQSPFNAFRCDDILFENNYAFGGGRYKFTTYQAENIVMRRNVARYDRGTVHNEPKGTYSIYTTLDADISNNLAIDGDSPDFVNQGELAGEFTTPTTSGDTRAQFQRNIQLNSAFLFGNMDEQISGGGGDSDVQHRDIISWDVRPASRYVMTWGSAWFDHMTMGEINPRSFADSYFNGYHNNSRGLTNSILHELNNGDLFYSLQQEAEHETVGRTVERYGVDTVNITGVEGELNAHQSDLANITQLNPIHSAMNINGALKYLTRVEANSNLSAEAKDGEDMGATVMTFKGQSGRLYGETDFNAETNIPMWPFPMEHVIKQKFAQYSYTGPTYTGHYTSRTISGEGSIIGARGFAVEDESLTNYVWGYLGNVVPPFNVTASVIESDLLVQWEKAPQASYGNISAYKIYDYDHATDTKTFLAEVGANQLTFTLNNIESGQTYTIAVTALNDSGQESGVGYPVSVSAF